LDIFSKFNNFANIFLTNKFHPGNERFKEPLSYKIKKLRLIYDHFFSIQQRKTANFEKIAKKCEKFNFGQKMVTNLNLPKKVKYS
jgi:hypothetical protein